MGAAYSRPHVENYAGQIIQLIFDFVLCSFDWQTTRKKPHVVATRSFQLGSFVRNIAGALCSLRYQNGQSVL